ncbi:amidohydrolase family protein [Thalassotalea sp. PLHSN55]|uniref:amidohydrolase family protein n=1 Tax=Thalassotalea sp. PLHSN55 TaxID=3435888 RepID=UPI003F85257B
MNLYLLLLTPLLLAFVVACSASPENPPLVDDSFLLTNVNIVDVENQKIQPAKNILINNGKIEKIADSHKSIKVNKLTVIDGKGGYITPGLIDMHVHMYEPAAYMLTLSHGVTHVRVMNGVPKQLTWRDNIEAGIQIGSSSSVSSPILSGYENASLHHYVSTAEQAKKAVQTYQAQGYDLIKAYGNLNQAALSGIIEQAQTLGFPVAKHGPHPSGDLPFSQLSNMQSFEHVEDIFQGPLNHQIAPEQLGEIISALKATDVPITPTLNIYQQLTQISQYKDEFLATTSPEYTSDIIAFEANHNQVKRWLEASDDMAAYNQKVFNFLLLITKRLHENNIDLLVGSDSGVLLSPHGIATHNEMQLLAKAGLSPYEVLAAATINPAKALKLDQQLGKIAQYYQADFIFSTANPIENLTVLKTPDAVVKNGRWYSQEMLIKMRQQAINQRSVWQEISVLFQGL